MDYYGYDYSAPNDYIAHYGVPGMKWGIRKYRALGEKQSNSKLFKGIAKRYDKRNAKALKRQGGAAKGYTTSAQRQDRFLYGKRGVKKINKYMKKKGVSHQNAKTRYRIRRALTNIGIGAGTAAVGAGARLYLRKKYGDH